MSTPRSFRAAFALVAVLSCGAIATPVSAAPAAWGIGYPDSALVANVASPDGTRIFATGSAGGDPGTFLTIAYDATTGQIQWAKTHGGGEGDSGTSIAVSPDGATVFVTGSHTADASTSDVDWATIAYDAATGDKRWSRKYDGPGLDRSTDRAEGIAVSPNGLFVIVTGSKTKANLTPQIRTAVYYAATGATRWDDHRQYGHAHAVAVSPDSITAVVVADYADSNIGTFAYDILSGDLKWFRVWDGPHGLQALGRDVVVSPNGQHVYSAGIVATPDDGYDYALLKYETDTGVFPWARRYSGLAVHSDEMLTSLAIKPDGNEVFVTGSAGDGAGATDYATVAYAASGDRLWTKRFDGGGRDEANSVVVDPAGANVYVTGTSVSATSGFDFFTRGYDATTGAKTWSKRYAFGDRALDLVVTGNLAIASGTADPQSPSAERAGLTAAFPL